MVKRTYTTAEAARLIGISKPTLLYWFKVRRVKDVGRDYNGWRVFTDEDIERLKAFREKGRPGRPAAAAATQAVGAERREWVRLKVELPVHYQFPSNGGDTSVRGESRTIDISIGGVMFEADLWLLPLRELSLQVSLPNFGGSIATGGEVRWARRWNDSNLLGVRFVGLREADRRLISEYIGRSVG